ncbi:FAD-binding protein [Streptomyces sp. NPDC058374]|uniref:FAD-binding protein n=1 Tax=unclassified Streptomyces TaxID=2593676 RepID=UPI00364D9CDC
MAVDTTVPLTGRGRNTPTAARLLRPRSYEEAAEAVRDCGRRGAIARGRGRVPGDAARNAGGDVLDMSALDRVHAIDASGGTVLCDAGITLHRLAELLLPLGWFVPVPPGTERITVGGALGADLHGANHHRAGSFARHVLAFELLTADGAVHIVDRGTPLFDATTGGLGLTGVVLTATVQLQPVSTALLLTGSSRATGLDDLMARLCDADARHTYATARVDLLARGAATGRGVVLHADHAPPEALPARLARRPLAARPHLPVPPQLPPGLVPRLASDRPLGRRALGLLQELRHRAAPRSRAGALRGLTAALPVLDGGHALGRDAGAVAYRCAVGHGEEEVVRHVVRRVAERGCASGPGLLKRFGEGSPGWLSFPARGWGLSLELPAGTPGLSALLDELDEAVAAAGGRVCLARDSRPRPELLPVMYPLLDDFRELRAAVDPRSVFTSDLARRLGL